MTDPTIDPATQSVVDAAATSTASPASEAAMGDEAGELRARLAEAEARLAASERRHEIETALREAGVVDLEAAVILIEAETRITPEGDAATGGDIALKGDATGDATGAVLALRLKRPYLFRAAGATASAGSAMSPAVSGGEGAIQRAAEEARGGNPNAVLRYMRLRREAH